MAPRRTKKNRPRDQLRQLRELKNPKKRKDEPPPADDLDTATDLESLRNLLHRSGNTTDQVLAKLVTDNDVVNRSSDVDWMADYSFDRPFDLMFPEIEDKDGEGEKVDEGQHSDNIKREKGDVKAILTFYFVDIQPPPPNQLQLLTAPSSPDQGASSPTASEEADRDTSPLTTPPEPADQDQGGPVPLTSPILDCISPALLMASSWGSPTGGKKLAGGFQRCGLSIFASYPSPGKPRALVTYLRKNMAVALALLRTRIRESKRVRGEPSRADHEYRDPDDRNDACFTSHIYFRALLERFAVDVGILSEDLTLGQVGSGNAVDLRRQQPACLRDFFLREYDECDHDVLSRAKFWKESKCKYSVNIYALRELSAALPVAFLNTLNMASSQFFCRLLYQAA